MPPWNNPLNALIYLIVFLIAVAVLVKLIEIVL